MIRRDRDHYSTAGQDDLVEQLAEVIDLEHRLRHLKGEIIERIRARDATRPATSAPKDREILIHRGVF
jgi:hypothetical protein